MEKIKGIIIKIQYYNKDNGYTVGFFELDYHQHENQFVKNRIIGNRITVVGFFDRQPIEEEEYLLEGDFIKDPKYGLQFKISKFQRFDLDSKLGVISYLASDLFPGIGIKIAKTVVEHLGIEAINIIKKDIKALEQVPISPKYRSIIYSGIISDQTNQASVLFFLSNGITMEMANKIIKALGDNAIEQVKANPYIIMDQIERFGFKKNDQFALRIGMTKNSPIRLRALISFILKELIYNSGNSFIPKSSLYERIVSYIEEEIAGEDFTNILNILENDQKIYLDDKGNIFDYRLYQEELDLAEEIVKFLKSERNIEKPLPKYNQQEINNIYEIIEQEDHKSFSEQQQVAIKSAFEEPIVIITGGPGTGKTTIVHAIIKMYLKLNRDSSSLSDHIALLAPTGRAAKRLKEVTNMNAMTIHRFLGFQGGSRYMYSKYNRTEARLVIIDEASMMDLPLAYRLITSMHEDARLIIVGDVDQLPSVGPGQILKDLIDTKEIKTIRLDKIHRQAENSSIIKLAHNINEGIIPKTIIEKLPDRNFIVTDNDHLADMLVDLIIKAVEKGKDIKREIQVLIPMYKGDCGITEINQRIQTIVNPPNEDKELKHLGRIFRIDDKVIQLVNHAEKNIMNGDIGFVNNFLYKNFKIVGLTVLFDSGIVEYNLDEIDEISLAYAISVHKAQGSEFDIVIMPISTKYYIMLKRKLIYTAVTRAKKTLLLIGDLKALRMGISQIEANRKTILKDKIIDYLKNGRTDKNLKKITSKETLDTIGEEEMLGLTLDDFE